MKKRKLRDLQVSAIGMGCMGFTHAYGAGPTEEEGIELVHKAFELGCNFFDTAEMYSYFKNEEFVGKALKDLPRDEIVISDKFWPEKLPEHDFADEKLSEAGIRKSLEGSLRRLQTDYVDVYIEHQMDDGSEEQVAFVMGKLIAEGKIRAWGQSSSTLEQIKKANAVTPIQPLLDPVHRYAEQKNCTAAQIGPAWVLSGGEFIVPIPGMRKVERIKENPGAAEIELTSEEYAALNEELSKLTIYGDRDGKDIKKLGTVPDNVNR